MKPVITPTYRKWPQLLIDTKNCIYQGLENVVISAMETTYQWPDFVVISNFNSVRLSPNIHPPPQKATLF